MLSRNIGAIDRSLRLVIGGALVAMVFVGPRTPWGWIGVVPILASVTTWCPLYQLLGIRTCGRTAGPCKR